METWWQAIGPAAASIIAVVLVIDRTFPKKSKMPELECPIGWTPELVDDFKRMVNDIRDLHQWHDKDDSEGVKIWYVRKSLETAINALSESVDTQTKVLTAMMQELREVHSDVKRQKSKA